MGRTVSKTSLHFYSAVTSIGFPGCPLAITTHLVGVDEVKIGEDVPYFIGLCNVHQPGKMKNDQKDKEKEKGKGKRRERERRY